MLTSRNQESAEGLAISESMRSRINGLNQAMSNIDDGISLTNVGEGALAEVHDMLHRMQTLAVEAANETYHTAARRNLEMGRRELLAEIDRIGSATDFGGVPLFLRLPISWLDTPEQDKIMRLPCRLAPQRQRP
ncbi:MAG: flagellin [Enterocloster clostridioformis]